MLMDGKKIFFFLWDIWPWWWKMHPRDVLICASYNDPHPKHFLRPMVLLGEKTRFKKLVIDRSLTKINNLSCF